eukprot:3136582-Heterocapsa_arctica.AAC.1
MRGKQGSERGDAQHHRNSGSPRGIPQGNGPWKTPVRPKGAAESHRGNLGGYRSEVRREPPTQEVRSGLTPAGTTSTR